MATKTILSDSELFDFLTRFPIPPVQSVDIIAEGSSNTNYLVRTTASKYILTILEEAIDQAILPYILDVFSTLETRNALTPKLVTGLDGKKIHNITHNKKAVLQTFLDGYTERDPDETQCFAAGRALANYHRTLKDSNLGYMPNPYNINGLSILFTENLDALKNHSEDFSEICDRIIREIAVQDTVSTAELAEGVIHGGFFRENVLLTENMVTGVIDLWFTCSDFYIADIALALNDWGFRKGKFIEDRFWALLEGYNSITPLSKVDLEALPHMLRLTALRYVVLYMIDTLKVPAPHHEIHGDLQKMLNILDYHTTTSINFVEEFAETGTEA